MLRIAQKEDYHQIREVIVTSFTSSKYGYTGEADLVDKIRQESNYVEVVFVELDKVVGHGVLSDSWIENDLRETINRGFVLAPLSVLPEYQKQGIGEKIIQELENQVKQVSSFISILGDPDYYKKFGYNEAKDYGIKPPFELPEEYFLIKEMKMDGIGNSQGTLKYNSSFD